jgi:hypothetical protein
MAQAFEFTPETLGGFTYKSLLLVSFLGLFMEMLLIRWVSSEIRIFAYFKNFVLIFCFLGFGLGSTLCRRKVNLLATLLPLLVVTTLFCSFSNRRDSMWLLKAIPITAKPTYLWRRH